MAIIYYALLVSFVVYDIKAVNAICNKFCDGSNPKSAAENRESFSAVVWNRKITLYISDMDNMCWASINGNPGDEVWLDRSFDGGVSWNGGAKLFQH
jgi:hypothetical protein